MANRSKIPEGVENFLGPDELKNSADSWQKMAKELEPAGKNEQVKNYYGKKRIYREDIFTVDRVEGHVNTDEMERNIINIHQVSFIQEVIPKLRKELPKGKNLKILDVGAGTALFSDQLRKELEDVKVYSTGLSKQAANAHRKEKGYFKMHPDDLKWRSILELSDFEEFDLIIDTFGELGYALWGKETEEAISILKRYLMAVIRKLNPGGFASITYSRSRIPKELFENVIQEMNKIANINIEVIDSQIIRINKLKSI